MLTLHLLYNVYTIIYSIVPSQVDKMRTKLANLNYCAVTFLSRAVAKLCWYCSIHYIPIKQNNKLKLEITVERTCAYNARLV